MKNSLSHIHQALNSAFELQPNGEGGWGKGVEIVEGDEPSYSHPIWWVAEKLVERVLTSEQLDELAEAGCLGNRGMAKAIRLGSVNKRAFCIDIRQLRKKVQAVEAKASKSAGNEKRVRELSAELKAAREHNAIELALADLLGEIRGDFKLRPYKRGEEIFKQKQIKGKERQIDGVPTLFFSDWHYGEVVSEAETEYIGGYNTAIAKERIERIFKGALKTLFPEGSNKKYEGIVVALGGDMISGVIHEELRGTNEFGISRCIRDLVCILSDIICKLAVEFPIVYVPCVSGNHGRLDKLPKAKRAGIDSLEHIMYTMVAMQVETRLGEGRNVSFTIAQGRELCFRVYNTTYLLTHGDEGLKGGREHGEFWGNLLRTAQHKFRKIDAQFGGFDCLMSGHFHRYGAVGNVVCNGSLKGFDEYGLMHSFGHEPPAQALWVTHPVYGPNGHTRLFADLPESIEGLYNTPPITPARCHTELSSQ